MIPAIILDNEEISKFFNTTKVGELVELNFHETKLTLRVVKKENSEHE